MISFENFAAKLKEFSLLSNTPIRQDTVKALHDRLKRYPEEEFSAALEELALNGEKFTLANLMRPLNRIGSIRVENEAADRQRQEADEAEKLWNEEYEPDKKCEFGACRGCRKLDYCKIRAREWLEGIKSIFDLTDDKGMIKPGMTRLGMIGAKKRAEEIIHFMHYDFMGGIISKKG